MSPDSEIGHWFKLLLSQAEDALSDASSLAELVESGVARIFTLRPTTFEETWAYLTAMVRMLSAYRRGDYREIPWKSLVTVTAVVIYVVNPMDMIPDAIPVIGLTDDAAFLRISLKVVKADLDAFMKWEISAGL